MKKIIIGFVLIGLLVTLLGCSKKNDLPYALPGEQYKILYVVPKQGNDERLHWFQEFQVEHKGVNLIAFDLELAQKEYPTLKVTEAPYIYILGRDNIAFKGSNYEEAKSYLLENTK